MHAIRQLAPPPTWRRVRHSAAMHAFALLKMTQPERGPRLGTSHQSIMMQSITCFPNVAMLAYKPQDCARIAFMVLLRTVFRGLLGNLSNLPCKLTQFDPNSLDSLVFDTHTYL